MYTQHLSDSGRLQHLACHIQRESKRSGLTTHTKKSTQTTCFILGKEATSFLPRCGHTIKHVWDLADFQLQLAICGHDDHRTRSSTSNHPWASNKAHAEQKALVEFAWGFVWLSTKVEHCLGGTGMHEGQEDLHRTYAGQRFCEAMPTKDAPASLAAWAACGWMCVCVCRQNGSPAWF